MERSRRTKRSRWVFFLCNIHCADGAYFPRFYFINPDGSVNYDIVSNPDSTTYQFYYPGPEPLVDAMKRMIKDLKSKKHRKQARMEKKQEEIEVDESQFAAEDL